MALRILRTNRIQASTTVLTGSSAEPAMPLGWLRDQLVSKAVRFKLGWDVVTGAYDKIDFNRGGVKAATVPPGNYATGAALATAIQAAMTTADGGATWTVTYDATTKKLTIACNLTFSLLFATGTNVAKSIHHDLGFADTDLSAASTYTGGTAVYQSRRWIGADFGSALSVQVGIARYFNSGAGGTFRLRGSSVSVADALTNAAPTVNQLLSGDSDIRIAYLATQTLRYWALLIDDTTNQSGYSEVGVWYAGPYDETTVTYSIEYEDVFEELSEVQVAIAGPQFSDQRPERQTFTLNWDTVLDADRATLIGVKDATLKGRNFFVSLSPDAAAPYDTLYGFRSAEMRFALVGPSPTGKYWSVALPFAEALP